MRYMSNEQVEQVVDTHEDYLARQVNQGKITPEEAQQEMRDLLRWARRHSH